MASVLVQAQAPILAMLAVWLYADAVLGIAAPAWLVAAAAAAAAIAGGVVQRAPELKEPLVRALGATILVLAARDFSLTRTWWLARLDPDQPLTQWLMGPNGRGLLGALPGAVLVLLAARPVFGLSLAELWGGRLSFSQRAWRYGLVAGLGLSAAKAAALWAPGPGETVWSFSWAGFSVCLLTNLSEEMLFRGLLLQVVRKGLGTRVALLWTGLAFGLVHGLTPGSLIEAAASWVLAWAVMEARSLWAGWVARQLSSLLEGALLR